MNKLHLTSVKNDQNSHENPAGKSEFLKNVRTRILSAILAISVLASAAALSGCADKESPSDLQESESQSDEAVVSTGDEIVDQFISFVQSGSYTDAIAMYNTQMIGNAVYESKASQYLNTYLEETEAEVLSGEMSEDDAKIRAKTVDKIYTSTNCEIEQYNVLTDNIDKAVASKAAYKSGSELMDSGSYIDAISEFEKVIPEDSNYKDALDKREAAIESYTTEKIESAKELEAQDNLLDAVLLLREASETMPNESDLLAELTVFEKNYINSAIEKADEAFVDYSKYQDALDVINSALQYFPEEQSLIEKTEYYGTFAPVSVYDMKEIRGKACKKDEDVDTFGNEYNNCFYGYTYFASEHITDVTYNLERNYNILTGTVYGRSTRNESRDCEIKIYGDDNLIYEATVIDNQTAPYDIELNVTGISELKIVMSQVKSSMNTPTGVGMTNIFVQRTEK